MLNFSAIDFETATSDYNSACSVAVVEVKDGVVADCYYTLIRPPRLCFLPFNIKIHGITPSMVKDEPDFAGIWDELRHRLEGKLIVAHNARFDMGVLKKCIETYGLPIPHFRYCCTVSISEKVWPDLYNHKLDTVGKFLAVNFRHHNAFDDAKACAAIPLAAARETGANSIDELAARLNVKIKNFS